MELEYFEITGKVFSDAMESDDVILTDEAKRQLCDKLTPVKMWNKETNQLEVVGECVINIEGRVKFVSLSEESAIKLKSFIGNDFNKANSILSVSTEEQ